MLITLFDLRSSSQEGARTTDSIRAARERKNLVKSWQIPGANSRSDDRLRLEEMARKDYSDFLDKDWGKREGPGLLSQTILEEEDDSEDGF